MFFMSPLSVVSFTFGRGCMNKTGKNILLYSAREFSGGSGGFHGKNNKNKVCKGIVEMSYGRRKGGGGSGSGVGGGGVGMGGGVGGVGGGAKYEPKGFNQEKYVSYLNNPMKKIIFAVGPAGSGKTLLACSTAIRELRSGNIDKIIMTRPLVSVDEEDIGFLPGTITNKMDPWTRPIIDIFNEFYTPTQVLSLFAAGKIEIAPLAYMRGRTFKRSFIIADEMQNSSPNQMLMMTTRLGENSRMVITGDLKQSDRKGINGLEDFVGRWGRWETRTEEIAVVRLNQTDIQRSPVVEKLIGLYSAENDGNFHVTNVVTNNGGGGCKKGGCGGCNLRLPTAETSKGIEIDFEKEIISYKNITEFTDRYYGTNYSPAVNVTNDAALIPIKDYVTSISSSGKKTVLLSPENKPQITSRNFFRSILFGSSPDYHI